MEKFNQYGKLFKETFILSAFTFGGGLVIVPLMQKKFVEELEWVDKNEMLDLVVIAQSSPGIMAVNTSIILGKKLGGFKGSLISTLGTVTPPLIILSIVSLFYEQFKSNPIVGAMLNGMQAAVAAVIICVALSLFNDIIKNNKIYNLILFSIAFILVFFFKVNVIYLVFAAIISATIFHFIKKGGRL